MPAIFSVYYIFFLLTVLLLLNESIYALMAYACSSVFFIIFTQKIYQQKFTESKGLIAALIILKVSLVFFPVILTGDLARYVFEGFVLAEGYSPYTVAPEQLMQFSTHPLWNKVEYAHLTAIYPPVAIYVFALFAKSIFSWKIFVLIVDFLNYLLIRFILKQKSLPQSYALIYFAAPLTLIEINWSAHLEVLMIFFVLLFLAAVNSHSKYYSKIFAPVLIALAIGVKYLPVVFAGIYFLNLVREKYFTKAFSFLLLTLFTLVAVFLPWFGAEYFSSLSTYLTHWRFNDSLLHLLGYSFNADWTAIESFKTLKSSLLLLFIALSSYVLYRFKAIEYSALYIFACYLLCSAVVHPWYLLWFSFLLCFIRSNACLYFSVAVLLSYQAQLLSLDDVSVWLKFVEYLPFVGLLVWELFVKKPVSLGR